MKAKFFIFFFLFCLCLNGYSKTYRTAKIIGKKVFVIKNNKHYLKKLEIPLQLEDIKMDSLDYYNNSLECEFFLKNKTKFPIHFKKEIYVWNDSGFNSERYALPEMSIIEAHQTKSVTVHIRNTMKRRFNNNGLFIIYLNKEKIEIPISLKLLYY